MASSKIPQRILNVTYINDPNFRSARAWAFTLVELLVVIVVILLLTAIVAPFMSIAEEQAGQSKCRKKLNNLHTAATMYGSENRSLVPIVHEGVSGGIGRILASGGYFAQKYMGQSWDGEGESDPDEYAIMGNKDNVFQCPSAFSNALEGADQESRKESTNYSLSGFGLYTGPNTNPNVDNKNLFPEGLHPSMMVIGGTVQRQGATTYPIGEVAMAFDWIRNRKSTKQSSYSKYNHFKGVNVLYGSGAAKWVNYGSMLEVTGEDEEMLVPPSTYGFVGDGTAGTKIYAPPYATATDQKAVVIPPYSTPGDRTPGVGVMW